MRPSLSRTEGAVNTCGVRVRVRVHMCNVTGGRSVKEPPPGRQPAQFFEPSCLGGGWGRLVTGQSQ